MMELEYVWEDGKTGYDNIVLRVDGNGTDGNVANKISKWDNKSKSTIGLTPDFFC